MSEWWTRPVEGFEESCDVVIVGSGAGGAFAAVTLAEAGLDVVMVEGGGRQAADDHSPFLAHAMSRLYDEGGFRTMTGKPPVALASGRALGGSTVINSAICFRTPEAILAEWNELSGGAFEDTEAFYRTMDEVEATVHVATTPDRLLSGLDLVHREAALTMGWSNHSFRRNTPTCVGCGRCNLGCPVTGKQSVDMAVLPRAARAGMRVYTRCQVDGVQAGSVSGYVVGPDGHAGGPGPRFHVTANQAVVLAAGALGNPPILLASGLDKSTGVGRGLRIHPVFGVLAFFEERDVVARGSTQGHYIDEFADDEMLLESNPTVPGQPFQMLPLHGMEAKRILAKSNRFAASGVMIRAQGEGRVLPSRGPGLRARFVLQDVDRLRTLRGSIRAARMWLEGLGADFVLLPLYGGPLARSMDDVEAALPDDLNPARLVGFSSHPLSTCGMGRVTDTDGQLLSMPGVYCMDGSVLPSNVGRNPQISVMTAARILAERLAVSLGRTPRPLWKGAGDAPLCVDQPGVPSGVRSRAPDDPVRLPVQENR